MDYDDLDDWERAEAEYEQMLLEKWPLGADRMPPWRSWVEVTPNPRYL